MITRQKHCLKDLNLKEFISGLPLTQATQDSFDVFPKYQFLFWLPTLIFLYILLGHFIIILEFFSINVSVTVNFFQCFGNKSYF